MIASPWNCVLMLTSKGEAVVTDFGIAKAEHRSSKTEGGTLNGISYALTEEYLFDANGTLRAEIAALAPKGERRMSASPHANGGALLRALRMPDFRNYAVAVPAPGTVEAEATRVLGQFLQHCDLVKFAKLAPTEDEIQHTFDACKNVIEQTKEASA